MRNRWAILIMLIVLLAGCAPGQQGGPSPDAVQANPDAGETVELWIAAAASLQDSLQEIKAAYEAENAQVKLVYNFGASGALQQQIEQGAPADLFLSAGKKQMNALVEQELIAPGEHTNLLTNELVVVIPQDAGSNPESMEKLTDAEWKTIAVGQPESVPAGSYAKEALTKQQLWEALAPKIVFAKDVRQVLSYVETGNADAGFVYKTDALASNRIQVAFAVDPGSYTPIEYPMGIVKATKRKSEAEALYRYLQSEPAQQIFEKYGFSRAKK